MGEFIYILLALNTLKGPGGVIESFTTLSVIQLFNPGIIPPEIHYLKWIVFAFPFPFVLISILKFTREDFNLFILKYGIMIFPFAVLSSQNPLISGLKFISFIYVIQCLLYGFKFSSMEEYKWSQWFQHFFILVLLGSYLIFFTEFGYLRNGRGFQGIFNHPQVMGVVGGLMTIWFLFFAKTSGRLLSYTLAFLSMILVFLSLARIGMVIIVGAWIIHWVSTSFHYKSLNLYHSPFKFFIFSSLLILSLWIFWEDSHNWFRQFILKRTIEQGVTESFWESRGKLITSSLQSFKHSPWTGIGLGISKEHDISQSFKGIPLSSPVEKGFMPSAILEELGFIGSIVTMIFLINMYIQIKPKYEFIFWGALLINTGEYVFFSMGGLGLIQWVLILYCNSNSMELKT